MLRGPANLKIYLQCLILDDVYSCHADATTSCVEAGAPSREELPTLLQTVIARLTKMPVQSAAEATGAAER